MVNLDTTQKFTVTVAPVDAAGAPGKIDGPPVWAIDDATKCHILPAADGLSCSVAGLAAGNCVVSVTALANGVSIAGDPIQCVVAPPPLPFATKLAENIGPVVAQ